MKLVIVESPSKAKTINKYLGSDFKVLASYGHVRDVPAKNDSVRPDEDFAMDWEVQDRGEKTLQGIAKALTNAEALYLASDPDREGEAIAWHVLQELKRRKKLKKDLPVYRVVFHEITKNAIQKAIATPKDIDMNLVEAYLARRALDYLVGFHISPLLWKKLPGAKSAGRVQSVALRLVCERENEIQQFVSQEYWSIAADLATKNKEIFTAKLTHVDGTKLDKFDLKTAGDADKITARLQGVPFRVSSIEKKQIKRNPAPPFTTSTLQQEASRKLGFGAKRTMQIAQQLYENGLITYMRTDAVALATEAIEKIRTLIQKEYGDTFLPDKPRIYKNTTKNAQEAHEAIRPTDMTRSPEGVKSSLAPEQVKLYTLIYKRTLACQMESARFDQVGADLTSEKGDLQLRATGQTMAFAGFIKVYKEDTDDHPDEDQKTLPPLNMGDILQPQEIHAEQHFTEPPPRFTEASLVKRMEELGIGRPSTYASILSVLQERAYVRLVNKRFIPELRGQLVTAFLQDYFNQYVQYDYTAGLEDKLDDITNGIIPWKKVLKDFWGPFTKNIQAVEPIKMSEVLEKITKELEPYFFKTPEDRVCPNCGKPLEIKFGKFGAFIGCSAYPACTYIKSLEGLSKEVGDETEETPSSQPELLDLGLDTSGQPIAAKKGPYGWYIQQGTGKDCKRVSLPKNYDIASLTKETALDFLALPKVLGKDTTTQEDVKVGIGRFGPYVCRGKTFQSIMAEDLFTLTLEDALKRFETPQKKEVQTLGTWNDEPITFQTGRYGPYVKWKKVMASVKKNGPPSLEEAIQLLTAKLNTKA